MASIFSRIIAGEIPCYKIKENSNFIAFLDVFPIVEGHVLVVPKQEVDKLFDAETQQIEKHISILKDKFHETIDNGLKT